MSNKNVTQKFFSFAETTTAYRQRNEDCTHVSSMLFDHVVAHERPRYHEINRTRVNERAFITFLWARIRGTEDSLDPICPQRRIRLDQSVCSCPLSFEFGTNVGPNSAPFNLPGV